MKRINKQQKPAKMKYSNTDNHALFCDQVQQSTGMFEQWNDCERTVVLYAFLKRLPFPNLRFLQVSIDVNLAQSYNSQSKLNILEDAANATTFINKLVTKYNSLVNISGSNDKIDSNSDIETLLCGSAGGIGLNDGGSVSIDSKTMEDDLVSKYNSKEEIIHDLLSYLPLLKPSNEEVKKIYIQLLPVLIEDSIKHNLPIELVQQIMSYLLIHPAITYEDRK